MVSAPPVANASDNWIRRMLHASIDECCVHGQPLPGPPVELSRLNFPAEVVMGMQESIGIQPDDQRRTPATPAPSVKKIQDIERLRGIAIASVIFCHLSLSSVLFTKMHLDPSRMPFFLGVELFFVISGFVVTKSFASKEYSFKIFYLRRIFSHHSPDSLLHHPHRPFESVPNSFCGDVENFLPQRPGNPCVLPHSEKR